MKTKVAKEARATRKGTDVQMKATNDISQADFFSTTISLSRMPNTYRKNLGMIVVILSLACLDELMPIPLMYWL